MSGGGQKGNEGSRMIHMAKKREEEIRQVCMKQPLMSPCIVQVIVCDCLGDHGLFTLSVDMSFVGKIS